MADFFDYRSPYRVENYRELEMYILNRAEYFLPIILVIVSAVLIVVFRDYFKKSETREKKIRFSVGIIFTAVYLSHYILRFALYQFDLILLPFQLCSISMFLAILLLFTKNKTIFAFVLYAGVIGGFISLFVPVYLNDSSYYRYYQYAIAHSLLILTPIYFMAVHDYIPSKKDTIYAFLILEAIGVFMIIFNYIVGTDYMFVFINADKIDKFPVIAKFGGIPLYLLWVHIAGISFYIIAYNVINFFLKPNSKEKKI